MPSLVASTTFENLLFEKQDAIAYVTLNRPKVLNALNRATWEDLRAAFEEARDDPTIRGVILTGDRGGGGKAFIAGADISELAQASALEAEESSRFGQEVLDLIENLGKPVIAAVNGFALGGGCKPRWPARSGSPPRTRSSASLRSSSACSPAAAAPSACRASWAGAAPFSSSFRVT
jgi:enoyl-CoA hydratase